MDHCSEIHLDESSIIPSRSFPLLDAFGSIRYLMGQREA